MLPRISHPGLDEVSVAAFEASANHAPVCEVFLVVHAVVAPVSGHAAPSLPPAAGWASR